MRHPRPHRKKQLPQLKYPQNSRQRLPQRRKPHRQRKLLPQESKSLPKSLPHLLNSLPLVKDIIAATKGNGADTMWTAAVETLSGGLTGLWKVMLEGGSSADIYRNAYKTIQGASQLSGIAVSGAVRDLVALYNSVLADGRELKRIQTYENTPKDAAKAIYAAYMRGDTDMVEFYRERAALYGIDAEKIGKKLTEMVEEELASGIIDAATAKRILTAEAGKDADKASEIVNEVQYTQATGLDYDDLRDDYAAGTLTESQVRSHLAEYGGLNAEEVEDKMSRYDYYIATGKTTTPPKYWRIAYAHETGGNYRKLIEDAMVEIIAGGRTEKQARSQIASSLKSYYADEYLAIEGTAAGKRMLEDILDVYEALGYSRDYQRKYIADNWFE